MKELSFQQKRALSQPSSAKTAKPNEPTFGQKLWASIPGRLAQGSVISDLMGAAQLAVRMHEPIIPLRMGQKDPYEGAAVKAVDGMVNDIERKYRAARVAAGQDISGTDWWRLAGSVADPIKNFPAVSAPSLLGRVAKNAAAQAGRSAVFSPVETENQSYLQGKAEKAAVSAATGGLLTIGREGLARVITPRNFQRAQDAIGSLPVVGDAMRAAQTRAVKETYPVLSQYIKQPADAAFSDLRPFAPPVAIDRGLPGLLSDKLHSEFVQSNLSAAIRNGPGATGIIGDVLRGKTGGVAVFKGIFGKDR